MKHWNRVLLLLACVILTVCMLAACTGEGGTETTAPAEESTEAPTEEPTAAPSESAEASEEGSEAEPEETVENPAEDPTEKPSEEPTEKPSEEPTESTGTPADEENEPARIFFQTLSVSGTDVYGSLSNDTEFFSFVEEIVVNGGVVYIVKDGYGGSEIEKTVALSIGDNTFYVLANTGGDEWTTYTVTLRRRPMYTVTFDPDGGEEVASVTVEEGESVTIPTPVRSGYHFAGWYDGETLLSADESGATVPTASVTYTARWKIDETPLEPFHYTVKADGTFEITGVKDKNATSYRIPEIVTGIGENAFCGCTELERLEIPDSVTRVEGYAFYGCTGLTSITVPDGVTYIGENAFRGCTGLECLEIPDGVTSIGNFAFHYCTGLTSITIPESVTSIGDRAFSTCTGLERLEIPDGVTSVGAYAFSHCEELTSVTVGKRVTDIGEYAFRGCYKLVEVIDHSSLTVTAGDASNGWVAYYALEVHDGESRIDNKDGYLFYTHEDVSYLVGYVGADPAPSLPADYNGQGYQIHRYAFWGCMGLTSIEIPEGVMGIGDFAFSNCVKLVEVINHSDLTLTAGDDSNGSVAYYALEVHDGESKIDNKDGYLFYTYEDVSYLVGYVGADIALSLPADYNGQGYQIGKNAFYGCTELERLEIPDSVTGIGGDAFNGCTGLASVTIGKSVTSIGEYAFYLCTSLSSITIPESMTSIGEDAFYGCTKLVEVINHSKLRIMKGFSSNGFVAYYAMEVHDGESKADNKDGYLFYTYEDVSYLVGYVGADTALSLPADCNGQGYQIYKNAFEDCAELTSLEIPEGVTDIGNLAFKGCTGLIHITIPDSVTVIGRYAFYGCTELVSVTVGKSVTIIPGFTFYGCTRLKSIEIPDSVKSIGDSAFYGCTGLTSATVGNSVKSIGEHAFYGCTELVSVTVGKSVTSIGEFAFDGCTELNAVYFGGTASEWSEISIGNCNEDLTSATLYYYSESKPTDAKNEYWYYDADGNPVAW